MNIIHTLLLVMSRVMASAWRFVADPNIQSAFAYILATDIVRKNWLDRLALE